MRIAWLALLLCFLGMGALCTASPKEHATLFESRSTWERFDWNHAVESPVWKQPGWKSFSGLQEPEKTWLSEQEQIFFGASSIVQLGVDDSLKEAPKHVVSVSSMGTRADCLRLAGRMTGGYGAPRFDDATHSVHFSEETAVTAVILRFQWDLGTTRATATCSAILSSESSPTMVTKYLFSLLYTSLPQQSVLIPKFAMNCTRVLDEPGGSGRTETRFLDFRFWVEPDLKMILLPSGELAASGRRFRSTDDKLVFETRAASRVRHHYEIDLRAGTLSGELSDNGRLFWRVHGTCTKAAEIAPAS